MFHSTPSPTNGQTKGANISNAPKQMTTMMTRFMPASPPVSRISFTSSVACPCHTVNLIEFTKRANRRPLVICQSSQSQHPLAQNWMMDNNNER